MSFLNLVNLDRNAIASTVKALFCYKCNAISPGVLLTSKKWIRAWLETRSTFKSKDQIARSTLEIWFVFESIEVRQRPS